MKAWFFVGLCAAVSGFAVTNALLLPPRVTAVQHLEICGHSQPNTIDKTCIVDGDTLWLQGTNIRLEGIVTCHGIFPPPSIRVRSNLRTDNEANEIYGRANHRHSGRA